MALAAAEEGEVVEAEEVDTEEAEEVEKVQEQPVSLFLSELGALGIPIALGVVTNASAVQEVEEVDMEEEVDTDFQEVLPAIEDSMVVTVMVTMHPTTRKKKSE